jgi:hypothetical protein
MIAPQVQRVSALGRLIPLRIVEVLQQSLATELAALPTPGLALITPEARDYYLTGERAEDLILAAPCAVIVEQYAPQRMLESGSGDGQDSRLQVLTPIRVRLVWSQDAYTPVETTLIPRPYTQAEHYQLVAEAYKAALIEAIYKYAQLGGTIDRIDLTSTFAGSEELRTRQRAVALCEWDAITMALIPMPRRFGVAGQAL